jgi:hypothetical protein
MAANGKCVDVTQLTFSMYYEDFGDTEAYTLSLNGVNIIKCDDSVASDFDMSNPITSKTRFVTLRESIVCGSGCTPMTRTCGCASVSVFGNRIEYDGVKGQMPSVYKELFNALSGRSYILIYDFPDFGSGTEVINWDEEGDEGDYANTYDARIYKGYIILLLSQIFPEDLASLAPSNRCNKKATTECCVVCEDVVDIQL